ncbi:lysine 2,3-aminomutase YodO family protein [gamma proteobacterium HTCC5015]|nr:lysine 2,3-aminomutase YodO family protein [gamma proteobacterium HTCC5015]
MIPAQPAAEKPLPLSQATPQWKREQAEAVTSPAELLRLVGLDQHPRWKEQAERAQPPFSLKVPRSYIHRMQFGCADDPLLLQALPQAVEHAEVAGFSADPVGDLNAQKTTGLLHKYHGRVLLVATGACAIHCRYCFRREYPYEQASATQSQWQESLDYIAADSSIHEVILSGGDPLTLSDKRLHKLIDRIETISHVQRLRIHSRLPIVLPSRVTETLCQRLAQSRLRCIMVVHANHAQELDHTTAKALQDLRRAGVDCLNQAVLLAGINDSVEALAQLSERLFEQGALPYYLHSLDRVHGAAHFEVDEARAKHLVAQLRERLSGYLVPTLVREIEGESSKTPL